MTTPIPQAEPEAYAAYRVEIVKRTDRLHLLNAHQIDDLAALGTRAGLYFGVLNLCVGAAISLAPTLWGARESLSVTQVAVYTGLLAASVLGAAVSGLFFRSEYKESLRRVRALKEGPSIPMVEYKLPLTSFGVPSGGGELAKPD